MKVMKLVKRIVCFALCLCMLCGNQLVAEAASLQEPAAAETVAVQPLLTNLTFDMDFYNIFSEETLEDNERKFVAERRGGYPFLTGCGGNNVFAPLPAPIPSNEVLNIKIDACGDFLLTLKHPA